MVRARAGDQDAYAVLVTRHSAAAHRAAALFGAGADTADVVQDAFVKAYRSLDRFHDGAPFRPWLLRIVINETKEPRARAYPSDRAAPALGRHG